MTYISTQSNSRGHHSQKTTCIMPSRAVQCSALESRSQLSLNEPCNSLENPNGNLTSFHRHPLFVLKVRLCEPCLWEVGISCVVVNSKRNCHTFRWVTRLEHLSSFAQSCGSQSDHTEGKSENYCPEISDLLVEFTKIQSNIWNNPELSLDPGLRLLMGYCASRGRIT